MQQNTSAEYLRALKILHNMLAIGQALLLIIFFMLKATGDIPDNTGVQAVLIYLVPILTVAAFFGSVFRFKKAVNGLKQKSSLKDKLNGYRAAFIVRDAMLEAPSLLSIIAYLLTHQPFFLAISVFIISTFFVIRPTKEKIIEDLELSSAAVNSLNNPEATIL